MLDFLGFLIFGLVVGIIAKFLMPGRDPGGCIITMLIGVAGSMLGGLIGRSLNIGGDERVGGWILSVVGALLLLLLYRVLFAKRTTLP